MEIKSGKRHEIADNFGMEFSISENGTSPWPNDVLDVDLYPTATTFEILERWEEENRINLNSFNPEDEIQLLDWYEINELWIINSDDIKSNLSDYITEGTLEKGKTVEGFAKNTD